MSFRSSSSFISLSFFFFLLPLRRRSRDQYVMIEAKRDAMPPLFRHSIFFLYVVSVTQVSFGAVFFSIGILCTAVNRLHESVMEFISVSVSISSFFCLTTLRPNPNCVLVLRMDTIRIIITNPSTDPPQYQHYRNVQHDPPDTVLLSITIIGLLLVLLWVLLLVSLITTD